MRWCWDVNEQYISVPNALISDCCPAVGVSQSLDADLDFFDITSSPVYRFSKYQTETIGAFSLLFVVVAINDREINPSISFKLQGPESITCHSDFIISVWIDRTDLFPPISSCSMPER